MLRFSATRYLTRHKQPELPGYVHDDAKEVALALLEKDVTKRLACQGRGAAEVKEHRAFGSIDWEKLMAMELQPPFEPDLDAGKPSRQPAPKDQASTSQLDFFCQMVDYMKTSMSMRGTWPLKPEDQQIFDDFDFVSNKARPLPPRTSPRREFCRPSGKHQLLLSHRPTGV